MDGYYERRCGGGIGGLLACKDEIWTVVWNDHAEKEDREDVEEENSEEGEFDGTRDGLSWVLGFTNSDTDQLSSFEPLIMGLEGNTNGQDLPR